MCIYIKRLTKSVENVQHFDFAAFPHELQTEKNILNEFSIFQKIFIKEIFSLDEISKEILNN